MVKKNFKAISEVILALEANPRDGHGECNEHNVDKERTFNLYEETDEGVKSIHKVNAFDYASLSCHFTHQYPESAEQMEETLDEIMETCACLPEGSSSRAVLLNFYEEVAPSLNTAKKYIWRTEDASGDITDLIKQEAESLLADVNTARANNLRDAESMLKAGIHPEHVEAIEEIMNSVY